MEQQPRVAGTTGGTPVRSAVTVTGLVPATSLGVALPHEHVLWTSHTIERPTEAIRAMRSYPDAPVSPELADILRRNPFATPDNQRQTSVDLAVAELAEFRDAGGGTVVDVSDVGIGRDPAGLAVVSRRVGLTIIAACGYYLEGSHPADLAARDVDDLAAEFVRELTVGIGETGVRAGIIGELGVGQPMYALPAAGDAQRAEIGRDEERVLQAAAIAQRATGAPISVHLWNFGPNALAMRALDILEAAGASPDRIAIGHLDAYCDLAAIRAVMQRGAFAELDAFGVEPYEGWTDSHFATDETRLRALLELIGDGHAARLLISQDVCTKMQLRRFGGPGYAHIERTIVPALCDAGVSDADLDLIRIANPARLLAWAG